MTDADPSTIEAGDRIEVTYETKRSDEPQTLTGTVDDITINRMDPDDEHNAADIDAVMYRFTIEPDESPDRADYYDEDVAPRRLTVVYMDGEPYHTSLEGRNGGRWDSINAPATDPEYRIITSGLADSVLDDLDP